MKIFLNDNYKGSVLLLDTPLVQEFALDFLFTRDDVVKIIPVSYYKGTKYDDVYISEIQSSLGYITHPSVNKNFSIRGNRYSYTYSSGKYEKSILGYDMVKKLNEGKAVAKTIWRAYHKNGRLACKVEYYDGKLINIISYFDIKGNALEKGSIKNGNGTVKEYDENGKLIKETTFSKGEIIE